MRAFIAFSLAFASGICAFAMAEGLSGSLPVAFLIGALAAGLAGWRVWTRPIVAIDEAACSRGLKVVSGVATVVALLELARLTVFMVAPAQVAYSTVPGSAWEVRHSCLSAYFVAGEAAGRGQDVYDDTLYNSPEDTGVGVRKSRMIGAFGVDVYEYPPTFLLVPRVLRLLTTDFYRMRALWFGLNVAFVLLAMVVVARRMGPVFATRALLLAPMAWAGMSMLNTLQKGNIQPSVVAMAMLAMVWFQGRRWAAGAALLAYSILAKLYPGVLGVYLLARRQWRAAAWTAAFGLVLLAATAIDIGIPPFVSFAHFLPGVLSGEAFPAFRNPGPIGINLSIPGLAFKAKLFGMPGMGFGAAKVLGWIYTAILLWVTVRAAQRPQTDAEKPMVWLSIILLATLRSPFLPQTYGVIPGLWLLTLLAATYKPTLKTLALVVVAAVALNLHWPLDWGMDPRLRAVLYTIPQAITIGLAVLALRRRVGTPEGATLTV
jgi:hypothetical protein